MIHRAQMMEREREPGFASSRSSTKLSHFRRSSQGPLTIPFPRIFTRQSPFPRGPMSKKAASPRRPLPGGRGRGGGGGEGGTNEFDNTERGSSGARVNNTKYDSANMASAANPTAN